jgi:hypothetical protein
VTQKLYQWYHITLNAFPIKQHGTATSSQEKKGTHFSTQKQATAANLANLNWTQHNELKAGHQIR